MKILIACEESATVREEFAKRGHDAWSCDIMPSRIPGNHIQGDVLEVINDGWDMMIAFPPCTYLSNAGIAHFNVERFGEKAVQRIFQRLDGLQFALKLFYSKISKVAMENPVGYLNTAFRAPDQVIEPYFFGDSHKKRTCLWLKNLPLLVHRAEPSLFEPASHVAKPAPIYVHERKPGKHYKGGEIKNRYFTDALSGYTDDAQQKRSKTFPGIARAMAEQWG